MNTYFDEKIAIGVQTWHDRGRRETGNEFAGEQDNIEQSVVIQTFCAKGTWCYTRFEIFRLGHL